MVSTVKQKLFATRNFHDFCYQANSDESGDTCRGPTQLYNDPLFVKFEQFMKGRDPYCKTVPFHT